VPAATPQRRIRLELAEGLSASFGATECSYASTVKQVWPWHPEYRLPGQTRACAGFGMRFPRDEPILTNVDTAPVEFLL